MDFSTYFSSGSAAGVTLIDDQTITSTGTYTKPAGALDTDLMTVDLWGGGGGGGKAAAATSYAGGGGGGGGHNRITFRCVEISATETVVVGAAGVGGSGATAAGVDGTLGGYSDFKGIRAYGGGYGAGTSYTGGGTGGGTLTAGRTYGVSPQGGFPLEVTLIPTVSTLNPGTTNWQTYAGQWGGACISGADNTTTLPIAQHGGGAADAYWPVNRNSIWGGGGGATGETSVTVSQTGGISSFGGAGGSLVGTVVNPSNFTGGNGGVRGGGGAGGKGTGVGGNGGRGEIRIRIYRGM